MLNNLQWFNNALRIDVHLIVLGNFIDRADLDPLVVVNGGPGQAGTGPRARVARTPASFFFSPWSRTER